MNLSLKEPQCFSIFKTRLESGVAGPAEWIHAKLTGPRTTSELFVRRWLHAGAIHHEKSQLVPLKS